jgi:choline dehydrogenase
VVVYGTRKKREALLALPADVYIVNHDGAVILADAFAARADIDTVVIDEIAEAARNARTARWRALHSICNGVQYRLKPGTVSVNELSRGWRLMLEAAKYAVTRKGLLTLSAAHVQAYYRTRPGLSGPDVQYHILPATADVQKQIQEQKWELEGEPGLTIAPCQLRPESRGTIHVKSADPFVPPVIRPNYLSDPIDQQTITEGLKFADVLANQEALKPWVVKRVMPEAGPMDDTGWLAYARDSGSTIYHPVGTCRMGRADDADAVVDSDGRVHGLAGLRVIDASVMPRLVSGNTNAPTIMIAEKMSDSILADAKAAVAA